MCHADFTHPLRGSRPGKLARAMYICGLVARTHRYRPCHAHTCPRARARASFPHKNACRAHAPWRGEQHGLTERDLLVAVHSLDAKVCQPQPQAQMQPARVKECSPARRPELRCSRTKTNTSKSCVTTCFVFARLPTLGSLSKRHSRVGSQMSSLKYPTWFCPYEF